MNGFEWVITERGAPKDVPNLWPYEGLPVYVDKCDELHPIGYICTRMLGHTGRHAAGGHRIIHAVWS